MPEPTIDLLYIDEPQFKQLFCKIITDLDEAHKGQNISRRFRLLLEDNICNSYASSIYNYFNQHFNELYDYDWIISIIKYYNEYPQSYENKYNSLNYSMLQIVELTIEETSKFVVQES